MIRCVLTKMSSSLLLLSSGAAAPGPTAGGGGRPGAESMLMLLRELLLRFMSCSAADAASWDVIDVPWYDHILVKMC